MDVYAEVDRRDTWVVMSRKKKKKRVTLKTRISNKWVRRISNIFFIIIYLSIIELEIVREVLLEQEVYSHKQVV